MSRQKRFNLKHTTIWVSDNEWDKLKFISASSGKTCSRFINDVCRDWINNHPDQLPPSYTRAEEQGKVRPLALEDDVLELMKTTTKKLNTKMSAFILDVVMSSKLL